MNTLEVKDNFLYLNGKPLPTNVNEFVGEVKENEIEYLILKLFNINIYCSEQNYKRLKGIPKKNLKEIKIIKPIPNTFMEIEKNSVVSVTTAIAAIKELISDDLEIKKDLLLKIKEI